MMAKLKYQQGFLKHEPPFTYSGEPNATSFKKWIREVCDWVSRARLSDWQGIRMLGKYLAGSAYKFFERDVLDLQKKYSLTEFFEGLFDYIFPPDFRMLQRVKFSECCQEGHQSIRDYLCHLKDLADTAGDIEEQDIVRQFWMNCQPYIKASLVDKGYEPNTISLEVLESKALRTKRAFRENAKDPNILLALNPTLAAGLSVARRDQASQVNPRGGTRTSGHRRPEGSTRVTSLRANSVRSPVVSGSRSRPDTRRGESRPHRKVAVHGGPPRKDASHMQALRDNNQCFECEQTGHVAKDCPKRHTLPHRPGSGVSSL